MQTIDFKDLNNRLLMIAERVLSDMFPEGKMRGGRFTVGDLCGSPGDSLSVNVSQGGLWKDFASNESGGDLISLYAAANSKTQIEAAKELSDKYCIADISFDNKKQPAAKKISRSVEIGKPPKGTSPPSLSGSEGMWKYEDICGDDLFWIIRLKQEDGRKKKYVQCSWDINESEWAYRAYPDPRPLYNLSKVMADTSKRVLIVEGEKAADAASSVIGPGTVVTTWPGGASAVDKADWSVLRGRNVTIWPDADDVGVAASMAIARKLHSNGCNVLVMDVSDAPEKGWDAADAVASGWTKEAISAWAKKNVIKYEGDGLVLRDTTCVVEQAGDRDIRIVAEGGSDDSTVEITARFAKMWRESGFFVSSNGKPLNNAANILVAFHKFKDSMPYIEYDEFSHKIMITPRGDKCREMVETDAAELMVLFQTYFGIGNMAKNTIWDAALVIANMHKRNLAKEYMEQEKWDGQERIGGFLVTACGTYDTVYTRNVSSNFFKSVVARVYNPGCQADNMVILEGSQGIRKTTLLRTLGGEFFGEIQQKVFDPREFSMATSGHFIVEMGELHAFRTAAVEQLKSFMTVTSDVIRVPYERTYKRIKRSCIFVGTTNLDDYLTDSTGGRRFWPIRCYLMDIGYTEKNRAQLWAEAVYRVIEKKEDWYMVPDEEAATEQESRRVSDEWEGIISDKLIGVAGDISTARIAGHCLGINTDKLDMYTQRRIGKCMRSLGFIKKSIRRGKSVVKIWTRPEDELGKVEF